MGGANLSRRAAPSECSPYYKLSGNHRSGILSGVYGGTYEDGTNTCRNPKLRGNPIVHQRQTGSGYRHPLKPSVGIGEYTSGSRRCGRFQDLPFPTALLQTCFRCLRRRVRGGLGNGRVAESPAEYGEGDLKPAIGAWQESSVALRESMSQIFFDTLAGDPKGPFSK